MVRATGVAVRRVSPRSAERVLWNPCGLPPLARSRHGPQVAALGAPLQRVTHPVSRTLAAVRVQPRDPTTTLLPQHELHVLLAHTPGMQPTRQRVTVVVNPRPVLLAPRLRILDEPCQSHFLDRRNPDPTPEVVPPQHPVQRDLLPLQGSH